MSEAKVPEKYSYLVPTGKHSYTNSVAMLHCQCKGAALLLALLEAAVFGSI